MKTVTEKGVFVGGNFETDSICLKEPLDDYEEERSCFYEFGVSNNDFIEELWQMGNDTIVSDVNMLFE